MAVISYLNEQDKDTSKYKMTLQQSLDCIKARIAWIKVFELVST